MTKDTIWNYDDVDELEQQAKAEYSLIPKGTMAKVAMTIERGGYNNPARKWTDGFATHNPDSGSVYLKVRFVVLEGQYAKRKIWGKIGLHSEKSDRWGRMGEEFAKGIVRSARRIELVDKSLDARNARKVRSLAELDGIEFVALIGTEVRDGKEWNVINRAVTPENKAYAALMNSSAQTAHTPHVPTVSSGAALVADSLPTEWDT
jgi:hypothetical protein